MRVMSYNTLFGGRDGADSRRYDLMVRTIVEAEPDVLLCQELKTYLEAGSERALQLEREIGMRGFIAIAPHTWQNTGVFIRAGIEPLAFEFDNIHFYYAAAILRVRVSDFSVPITFISVHLCPLGPHIRMTEASALMNFADPGSYTLIGGDFNSVSPQDNEPEGWDKLPSHFQSRYLCENGTADRITLATFERMGLVDLAASLGQNAQPTVPTIGYPAAEFVPFRSDYFLASQPLAQTGKSYQVIRSPEADHASDHYPILAEFST